MQTSGRNLLKKGLVSLFKWFLKKLCPNFCKCADLKFQAAGLIVIYHDQKEIVTGINKYFDDNFD